MSITMERLKDRLKRSEGWRPTVYTCPAGKLTIGYGFNVEDTALPKKVAEIWLETLIEEKAKALEDGPEGDTFRRLSDARQNVIIDMAYNLGITGVLRFRRMWYALKQGAYKRASIEMLDSRWADQVGRRAEELAHIMETGEDIE